MIACGLNTADPCNSFETRTFKKTEIFIVSINFQKAEIVFLFANIHEFEANLWSVVIV